MPRRGGGALGLAVRQRGSVAVIELDCSEMTIRRDLAVPGPVFRHCPARLVALPRAVRPRASLVARPRHRPLPAVPVPRPPATALFPVQDLLRRPDVKRQAQSRRQPSGSHHRPVRRSYGYWVPTAQVPDGLAVLPLDGVFEQVGEPSAGGDVGDVGDPAAGPDRDDEPLVVEGERLQRPIP